MKRWLGYVRMKIERRARWDSKWRMLDRLLRLGEEPYWRLHGKELIECFGDSHVKVMRRLNWLYPDMPYRFRTVSVMGATAYGMATKDSTTGARERFEWRLSKTTAKRLLFMLGEVDTGYLIWKLAGERGLEPEQIMEQSIQRYMRFLGCIKEKEIHVCSAPLPTVQDGGGNPEYMSIRNEICASQQERTQLALSFNQRLKSLASERGWHYIDLDTGATDPDTGLVRRELLSKNASDHHYDENAFAEILHSRIAESMKEKGRV